MIDLLVNYSSEIVSLIVGLLGGGIAGSLITIKNYKGKTAIASGRVVDQSNSRSRGDIVGGNKTTTHAPKRK